MAGRKPPSKPDFFSLLLNKIGMGPAPQKGKKKRRPKGTTQRNGGTRRLDGAADVPFSPGEGGASPFADYGQESGLGFSDAVSYEAAAAAGYAPPAAPGGAPASTEALFGPMNTEAPAAPAGNPSLPTFGATSPEQSLRTPRFGTRNPAPAPEPIPAPTPGSMFNVEALDNSLDALFSGLETGTTAPPASIIDDRQAANPSFDSYGLTEPVPVSPVDNLVAFPTPEPPSPERPKPAPPIISEAAAPVAPPVQAPVQLQAGSLLSSAAAGSHPAATVVTLSEGQDLKALMATIDRCPGVGGSLLVGYDGLIIMSTLPPDVDRDYLGAQASNLFSGMGVQLQKMKRGELRRLMLESDTGAMLMTAADMGILVVVSHEGQAMDAGAVLTAIAGALA